MQAELFVKKKINPALPSQVDDYILLKKIAERKEDALLALYERYSRLVFSTACHIVSDRNCAENILYELFLDIWKKPNDYEARGKSLAGALVALTRNRAIALKRTRALPASEAVPVLDSWGGKPREQRKNSVISIDAKPEAPSLSPKRKMINSPLKKLDSMPGAFCEVLHLALFQGLTQEEISTELGVPLATVKLQTRSALKWIHNETAQRPGKTGAILPTVAGG